MGHGTDMSKKKKKYKLQIKQRFEGHYEICAVRIK